MGKSQTLRVPLNRVEGDLEIRTRIQDGVVRDAWCSGTMFRGFERILTGRGALDGLVITPRICGVCSTSHLTAAVRALDQIAGVTPPADALRVRNVALMAEHIQSDMRHAFLMFTPDFARQDHRPLPLYEEAVRRYRPLQGGAVLEVIRQTKKVLEIVAILGGQWPHSSFMVPGGVVGTPADADLQQCRLLLRQYRQWYEQRILGCVLERWLEVDSAADLEAWLQECPAHRDGELGFYVRFARQAGLDSLGRGPGNFLSFGSLDLPEGTSVRGPGGTGQLVPAGFARGVEVELLDQLQIAEHVAYSWFRDHEGGCHPAAGETQPYATGDESRKYSWAKAPRYAGLPAETGPLAEMVMAGHPLITDLVRDGGASAFTRQLARLVRPAHLMPAMGTWLEETRESGRFYVSPGEIEGAAFGLTEAARGALGHWVEVRDGVIANYQVITPTAWNASPRDDGGTRGPIEEALIGTPAADGEAATLGHVVRSFDPCLVCTVH